MSRPSTVQKALQSEVPQLSKVLARAFHNDRIAEHVLPDKAFRQQGLERVYQLYFKVFLPNGACYTTAELDGAALWMPPGKYPLSAMEHIRLLPGMLHALGIRRLPRALNVLDHLERMLPVNQKYWYLGVLGVEPDRQRHGIGSRLMQPALAACDEHHLGAYLETGTESNLRFYAVHGFQVMHEFRLPNGPKVWGLWREPVNL